MKRLVFDLDGTLTIGEPGRDYEELEADAAMVEKLRQYRAEGFTIIIATSRNMRTYNASIGHINANTLPAIVRWLDKHDIPYDEIHVGKPWCGHEGFYVDDKAIRPSEFRNLSYDQIVTMLAQEEPAPRP